MEVLMQIISFYLIKKVSNDALVKEHKCQQDFINHSKESKL
jgi:hypothetical protein